MDLVETLGIWRGMKDKARKIGYKSEIFSPETCNIWSGLVKNTKNGENRNLHFSVSIVAKRFHMVYHYSNVSRW